MTAPTPLPHDGVRVTTASHPEKAPPEHQDGGPSVADMYPHPYTPGTPGDYPADHLPHEKTGAVRSSDADGWRFDLISPIALTRLAATYAEGCGKYGEHNWLKGFRHTDVANHAFRHLMLWISGDTGEDHLGHLAWNIFTLMHYEESKTGEPIDKVRDYSTAGSIKELSSGKRQEKPNPVYSTKQEMESVAPPQMATCPDCGRGEKPIPGHHMYDCDCGARYPYTYPDTAALRPDTDAGHNLGMPHPSSGLDMPRTPPKMRKPIQSEIGEWSKRNFGEQEPLGPLAPFLGMVEEVGELAHAILKRHQGIRGFDDPVKYRDAIEDGIADLRIFLYDFSDRQDINCDAVTRKVWDKVRQRDWLANPANADQQVTD